jgi:hypothetical protein
MGKWLDLHIQLAETVGDPRDKSGVFITNTTDGIRYTAAQRSRVLSQAIRWLIRNFDGDDRAMWTSLLVIDECSTPIANEDMGYGTTISKTVTLLNSSIKLLSIEGAMIMSLDPETNLPINYLPPIMIPIINKKHKKLLRTKNSHWNNTPFAYVVNKDIVGFINVKNYNVSITYIKDFDDFTNETTDDTDIYIPSNMMHFVVIYAVHLLKLNEQRWKEAVEMKNDMITEIITFKNMEDGNVSSKAR